MKIMDIHCHIFPDRLAEKAEHSIGAFYGAPMYCAASVDNLLKEHRQAGITRCVVSNSAVNPAQVHNINSFLAQS